MSGPEHLVGKGQIKSSQVIQACDSSMVNHSNKRVKGPTTQSFWASAFYRSNSNDKATAMDGFPADVLPFFDELTCLMYNKSR